MCLILINFFYQKGEFYGKITHKTSSFGLCIHVAIVYRSVFVSSTHKTELNDIEGISCINKETNVK